MMKLQNGFTLIELLIAITIGAILMIFIVAPYNFYSEKSRSRLSAERVTQAISKAKMMAVSGYAPRGKNVDMVVVLEKDSSSIYTYSFPSTGSGGLVPGKNDASALKFEDIPLESGVTISKLPLGGANSNSIILIFRAPTGSLEIGINPANPIFSPQVFSGGIVGYKGVQEGVRSTQFTVFGK